MTRQRVVNAIHPAVIECRRQGRTLADLAEAAGYDPRTISGALSSRRTWPRLREAIAAALGRSTDELFADELAELARPKPWTASHDDNLEAVRLASRVRSGLGPTVSDPAAAALVADIVHDRIETTND